MSVGLSSVWGMSQSASNLSGVPVPGSPESVLAAARHHQRAIVWGEAGLLAAAVEWAGMHQPSASGDTSYWWEGGNALPLAGAGAPEVAEYAVAELAAAVGITTDAGRRLVGHALELAHRLPRLWAQVQAGRVPVWRARRVAEATVALTAEAAGFVDAQVAAVVGRVGIAQLDRLVLEAQVRFEAAERPDPSDPCPTGPDRRRVELWTDQVSFDGTVALSGELDLVDALHLDQALSAGAEQLALAGSTESFDARRATTLGEMARDQLTLTYDTLPAPEAGVVAQAGEGQEAVPRQVRGHRGARRPVTLFVHLCEAAVTGDGGPVGRCENTRTPISVETIREWCGHPDATVTVRPVLDLAGHVRVDAYEIPERLKDLVDQRDGQCVFPWCTRRARRCDHDHVVPFDPADPARGPTCSCNIAALCRGHHRLKTDSPWRYLVIEPGVYLWHSPYGLRLLVDDTGTRDVTPPHLTPTGGCHLADPPIDPPNH